MKRPAEPPISLSKRRAEKAAGSLATCECGSQWFRATVCFEGGRVTGYRLDTTVCDECGAKLSIFKTDEESR